MKIRRHSETEYIDKFIIKNGLQEISMFSILDISFMDVFGMTSPEYNIFCEESTEEELSFVFSVFDGTEVSFTSRRKALEIINKYKVLANENSK